ncbi:hypothetical protein FD29_GL001745 [Companilactobacillus mindensis DSM 14500]|uniref:Siphovirus Gp157 family protein n=1 Tax=Companilactobacillus mindensis DSM 14500 TaxID=1423770 RepID=A0A0R1QT83_9LACO|nr:siphovirus Gp157 family protein [Companilactobacillus mindensis]KRL45988.1 hypothetical protein FD29_GL001745 [Companilactobacillus mindensis DSM 14500]GEO78115.1 hypothetical protein LMI01_04460 [Companilactobacillus mindensis]
MSVYKLTGKLLELQEHADDIDPTTFNDTANSIKLTLDSEYDGCMDLTTNLKSDEDGINAEIKRLQARKKAIGKSISYIRDLVAASINASGRTKVKTPNHTYSVPGTFKSEVKVTPSTVPAEFYDQKPTMNRSKVKDALLKGKTVGDGRLIQTFNMTVR